jgi:acetylornithine deacetylase/succinyl-diaminopimelate desuccinylase family protein
MANTPDASRMKGDLEKLVAFKTENPPGEEIKAAGFLADILRKADFNVAIDEYKKGRANVIARLDNGDGPTFAFNTHMDVVPAGDGWSGDPFVLREKDGKLYGRGSCDAKGPLIAMVEAMRLLSADRKSWRGTLLGVFVGDEEVASEGARHYASTKPKIDYAVIGEPTNNGTVIAHKGSLRPWVRVHGVSAHSGTPDLGENAIYNSTLLIGKVEEFHRTVLRKRTHPLVGEASLTITRMNAGIGDNVVPPYCDLLLDRRMVPGENEDEVKKELVQLVASVKSPSGKGAEILEYKPTTGGAVETAADQPIVAASITASKRHGAKVTEPQGLLGACDLVHFRAIGAQGTVMGPGSLAVAHKPDEFVPVDEFVAASLIYRDIAAQMMKAG